MPTVFIQILRSRGFAWCVHAGFWWLLVLIVTHLGSRSLEFSESRSYSTPPQCPVPVSKLAALFAVTPSAASLPTNSVNPFFTRYFEPAPAPPAPTTRKLDITYLGFYEAGDNPKHAVVKLADAFIVTRLGMRVTTNFFISEATMQTLTLTNGAGQTNVLPLNIKKEIEVPIK